MRANLDDNGKLTPPRNIDRGLARLKQLRHEIKRLGGEIDTAVDNKTATEGWLARAKKNKALLRAEYLQLVEWISHQAHDAERDAQVRALPCFQSKGAMCVAHARGAAAGDPCNAGE